MMSSSGGDLTWIWPTRLPVGANSTLSNGSNRRRFATLRTVAPHPPALKRGPTINRAIDRLSATRSGPFDSVRRGRLGLLTSGHRPKLISLGGTRIPRVVRTRSERYVYKTADWGAYAESGRKGLNTRNSNCRRENSTNRRLSVYYILRKGKYV